MDTIDNYRQRIEERKIVKQETKTTIIICLCLLVLNIIYGVAAYFIDVDPVMKTESLEKIYGMVNLGVVMFLIVVLAVRKTIYYSPKFIREDFNLRQVLVKWKRIDIFLLVISEIIPICGLVMTFMGMPFDRNFHFFVASGILIILLTPLSIKVRSRLSILRKHFPNM
ncbi:MAG: hypothetical protein JSV88_02745 [Candidatus Aminicenantes bacterium]|nr:MAG: hypothetical protein JSV88_02745 [Candidatus Aminicenantes bacterium]